MTVKIMIGGEEKEVSVSEAQQICKDIHNQLYPAAKEK